jgi:hypothetical protein
MKHLSAPRKSSSWAAFLLLAVFSLPLLAGASAVESSHPAPAALGVPSDAAIELRLARGQVWNGKTSLGAGASLYMEGTLSGSHIPQATFDRATRTLTVSSPRPFLAGEMVQLLLPHREGFSGATLSFQVAAGPASARFEPRDRMAVGSGPNMLAAADLDTDGDVDLLVSEVLSKDGIHIFLNDGLGRFTTSDVLQVPGFEDPARFAVGDLDRDGNTDLVLVGESSANLIVLHGRGNGGFAAGEVLGLESGTPVQVVAGDLNLDGFEDVVVAHLGSSDRLTVLQGGPTGGFQRERRVRAGRGIQSLALADLDADGDLDLATANEETGGLAVLANGGDGRLEPAATLPTGGRPETVVAADMNADGIADLVAVNQGTNEVSTFLGRGDLGYDAPVSCGIGDRPFIPALADLDGDGDLDLAVPGLFSDDVSILLNQGRGAFNLGERLAVDPGPVAVAAADFDGNGTLDLAVASSVGDNVQVWANIEVRDASAAARGEIAGLAQNVPNPFNPATEIAYSLSRPGYVSLVVFNTSGKVVRTLVAGFQSAGHHFANWDGTSDEADRVPSGIYFYRLTTEETVELRRMALLR